MRRRFENVNMAMGNCFSPVMEGSQFQWNNIVVLSSTYKCNFLGADNKQ